MLRAIPLTLLVALAFAACGGDDDSETQTPSTAATASPAASVGVTVSTGATRTPGVPQTEPATNILLPPGFTAYAVATGFYRPTSIAVASDGTTYVSESGGSVYELLDANGDGVFESEEKFYEAGGSVTGILASPDGGVYVSTTGATILAQGPDDSREIISGLPNGRHQNNGLAIGPDGKLYLTNGSDCDDCIEESELSAAILQANPDGSDLRVYASGLRNPYDITFDAQGRLWATDNGSDDPCATVDELNLIVDGGDYGWPYEADGCDNFDDGIAPVASLGLHTASTGIDSYDASAFPEEYRGDLFMTIWGSFFAPQELPPQLLRAAVTEEADGPTATVETFGEGFEHPIDVFVDNDGSLLVLDYGSGDENDTSGVLYRVVYLG